ncbi:hypothetical protein [Saccharopolyspora hattusasensis]|uniref:hypothetical protein n=1 Tax=Saccharopolyspora hattusasensis TaxID=1128679 RepID=UPI003D959670
MVTTTQPTLQGNRHTKKPLGKRAPAGLPQERMAGERLPRGRRQRWVDRAPDPADPPSTTFRKAETMTPATDLSPQCSRAVARPGTAMVISHEYAAVWTDHLGVVHERQRNERHRTLCDINAGESNHVVGPRVCRGCVMKHFEIEADLEPVSRVA